MLKPEVISQLRKIAGNENVLTSEEEMAVHSTHMHAQIVHPPEAVVLPTTTQQVSEIMKLANEHKIPVTPRGGSASLEGGSTPIYGGISLVMTKMNKIITIEEENLIAIVEPGVILSDFQDACTEKGVYFPPDPGGARSSTIGGVVADNSSGPSSIKYGTCRDYVIGLEVVLPSGEIMNVGGLIAKNAEAYNLSQLITGSEGTLGVITKAIFKLLPAAPFRKTITATFNDLALASTNISKILAAGIIPFMVELMDNYWVHSMNETHHLGLPEDAQALLFIQCNGSIQEAVDKEAEIIADICRKGGATDVKEPKAGKETANVWDARAVGGYAIYKTGKRSNAEDMCVPRTKITEFIERSKEIAKENNVDVSFGGHAADGALHPRFFYDPDDAEYVKRMKKAVDEQMAYAISLGGLVSSEHGIGARKKKYITKYIDPMALDVMKKIKAALDPNNIMNPGKLWE